MSKTKSCWLWRAYCFKNGYGQFYVDRNRVTTYAHRVSWEIHFGEIPKGMCVLHKCDVANCVNPDHLFIGTHKDNADDKIRKGRGQTGGFHHATYLTESHVLKIRKESSGKRGEYTNLAKKYGTTRKTVSNIIKRETWKYI